MMTYRDVGRRSRARLAWFRDPAALAVRVFWLLAVGFVVEILRLLSLP